MSNDLLTCPNISYKDDNNMIMITECKLLHIYYENRQNNKETFQHQTLNHSNKTKSEREAECCNFMLLTH